MDLFKLWGCTFLFFGLCLPAFAQISITQVEAPEGLVACGEPGLFRLHLANGQNEEFSSERLVIQMPEGMSYVEGSIAGAAEANISSNALLEFTLPPSTGQSFVEISFQAAIDCRFSNANPIRYIVSDDGVLYTAEVPSLANYFFPEVVAVSIENQSISLSAGQTGQRRFSVIQSTPGARLDTLFLVARYNPQLQSSTFNLGNLVAGGAQGDTLVITGGQLPGGDGSFDFGDTLSLVETIRLLGCAESTSEMELFWRCNGQLCQAFYADGLASLANGSPNLVITNQNGFSSQNQANDAAQVGGGFCQALALEYRIENSGAETAYGAGAAYSLTIAFGLNNNLYSSPLPVDISLFPNWNFRAWIGGIPIPLSAYQFPGVDPMRGYNLRFNALATDPDGPGGLEDLDGDGFFDDLPVGASTLITILVEYDPLATTDCTLLSGFPNTGGAQTSFRIGYHHFGQCGDPHSYWYGVTDPGINIIELFVHRRGDLLFSFEPENLQAGRPSYLQIAPVGDWSSPCAPTDSFILQLVLPAGLMLGPGPTSGPGMHYGLVESSGDTLRIAGSERGGIDKPWKIPILPDCSSPVFDAVLQVRFIYFCSPDCPISKEIDCQEITLDYRPQCVNGDEGVINRNFDMRRRTLGWKDVFQSERVNPVQNPNINLKAALNYDSVELRLTGVYQGNGPFDSLFARVSYSPINLIYIQPQEPHFTPLSASMAYFSQSAGLRACPVNDWTESYDAATGKHHLDFELETLFAPGGCLEGVPRSEGDSIVFSAMTLVTGNTPIKALPVPELLGGFYSVVDGRDSFCNQFLEHFILENAVPRAHVSYGVQLHFGCEEVFFTGNFINNFGHLLDGDQFPDEVRPLADVSELRILLEGHWGFTGGSATLLASGSLNAENAPSLLAPGITASLPDPAISFDGAFTVFTFTNPGNWPNGDLAINGNEAQQNLRFRARPGCTVPRGQPFRIRMEAEFTRFIHAPPQWQAVASEASLTTANSYEGQRSRFVLASPQVATSVNDTVSWAFKVDNITNYAGSDKAINNNWIAIEADEPITILELRDISNPAAPVVYPPLIYGAGKVWFRVGTLPSFASRKFQLAGLFGDCSPARLVVYHGYSCLGYPSPDPDAGFPFPGPTSYFCPADSLQLMARPGEIAIALEVSATTQPVELCQTLDYHVDIRNLQLPYAYGLDARITLPQGVHLMPASSMLEYPSGSGNFIPLDDPVQSPGGQWSWNLAGHLPFLRSVAHSPANQCRLYFRLETDCSFLSGRRILLEAGARSNCGQESRRQVYSLPIRIEGIPAIINNYAVEAAWPDGGIRACSPSRLQFKLVNLGPFPTSAIEYGALALPRTLDYSTGSLVGIRNAPTGIADNTVTGDTRLLAFLLPAGVLPGDSIVFTLEVADQLLTELPCDALAFEAFSLLRADVSCADASGGSCNIFAISTARSYTAPMLGSRWKITPGQWSSVPSGTAGEWVTGPFVVKNITGAPIANDQIRLSVFFDQNDNAQVDGPEDSLLATHLIPLSYLGTDSSLVDSLQFFVPTGQACRLLLAVDDPWHTCACDTLYAAASLPLLRNAGPDVQSCSGDTLAMGIDLRQDSLSFQWSGIDGAPLDALFNPASAITQAHFSNLTDAPVTWQYRLTTTRVGQCTTSDTLSLSILPEVQAEVAVASDYNGQDISCHGFSDGMLEVTVTAGTLPYIYRLGGVEQGHALFEGLSAGQYTFHLEDGGGCRQTVSGTLTEPDPLGLAMDSDSTSCANGADGRITVVASGGNPQYHYSWSNGIQGDQPVASMLAAGVYQLTLTDSNGCALTDSMRVGAPLPLSAALELQPASCADKADGKAMVGMVSGGTGPYVIRWDDGRQGPSNSWLSPGTHYVVLADAKGCSLTLDFEIEAPPPLSIAASALEHVRCYGSSEGAVQIEVVGGSPSYSFLWNNGDDSSNLLSVPAGNYWSTITDARGCLLVTPAFRIEQPPALTLSVAATTDVSCYGDENGTAAVVADGGTAPYTFLWNNGEADSLAVSLPPGTYDVSVTDANDCRQSVQVNIGQPPPMAMDYQLFSPNCVGRLGSIILTPNDRSGTPPFQYSIDGGTTFTGDGIFSNLEVGHYQLAILDAYGCRVEETIELPPLSPLSIQVSGDLVIDYGTAAYLSAVVAHAQGDVEAHWSPADGGISCSDCLNPVFTPAYSTTYHLSVMDENGCRADTTIQILVERPRRVFIPNAFSPNGDGKNDTFLIYGGDEVEAIEKVIIAGRWGNILFQQEQIPPNQPQYGWDGWFRGQKMPTGVYVYQVDVLFTDGLRKAYRGEVLLLD